MKRTVYEKGFSLIELITVILVIGILAIGVSSRFSSQSNFQVLTTRDDIVAGLFYAQQIALARSAASNSVEFISTGTTIDVQEAGVTIGNGLYPLALPSGVSLTPVTLSYNKLGQTAATNLTVTDGQASATIQVSASGYAN